MPFWCLQEKTLPVVVLFFVKDGISVAFVIFEGCMHFRCTQTGCWLHVNLATISYRVVPIFCVVFTLMNHLLGNPAVLHLPVHETLFMWCIRDSSV
jgi:hypothetical protein